MTFLFAHDLGMRCSGGDSLVGCGSCCLKIVGGGAVGGGFGGSGVRVSPGVCAGGGFSSVASAGEGGGSGGGGSAGCRSCGIKMCTSLCCAVLLTAVTGTGSGRLTGTVEDQEEEAFCPG